MKCVKLYHKGNWYKAYNDDAKIVAFIMDYKLFEDIKSTVPSVGFPESSLEKVIDALCRNKINYILPYDENKLRDFGKENNYDKFLFHDLPFSYVVDGFQAKKKPKGSFIVKYDNEPEEEFVIGENINEDAELVKCVEKGNVGDILSINDYKIEIISKNIEY